MPEPAELDQILAIQLAVAWAGEALSEPRRLGWWATDLLDPNGGGDLLRRLAPRTAVWAGLEAVREAARRVDAKARRSSAGADQNRSLFYLGFELDEALDERLATHKRGTKSPQDVLPVPDGTFRSWSPEWFESTFASSPTPKTKNTPAGRQLIGRPPSSPVDLCRNLAAALLPIAPAYPCPYYPT